MKCKFIFIFLIYFSLFISTAYSYEEKSPLVLNIGCRSFENNPVEVVKIQKLLDAISREMKIKVLFQASNIPAERAIFEIKQGTLQGDLFRIGLFFNNDTYVYTVSEPFVSIPFYLYSANHVESSVDLKGKIVILYRNSQEFYKYFMNTMQVANIYRIDSREQGLDMIINGRADYFIADGKLRPQEIAQQKKKGIKVFNSDEPYVNYLLCMILIKEYSYLNTDISNAIKNIKNSGELYAIFPEFKNY